MIHPMWGIAQRRVLPVLAVVAAGAAVLAVAGDSAVGIAVGLFLLGAAGVLAISFVFLEIGLSEDRERAAGAGRRSGRDVRASHGHRDDVHAHHSHGRDAAALHGPERHGGSHGPARRQPRRRRPE